MPNPNTSHRSPESSNTPPEAAASPKETKRYHVVRGIKYEVVETWYDPKTNQVMDKIRKIKLVNTKNGGEKEVEIFNIVRSQDEALQAKFNRDPNAKVVING